MTNRFSQKHREKELFSILFPLLFNEQQFDHNCSVRLRNFREFSPRWEGTANATSEGIQQTSAARFIAIN